MIYSRHDVRDIHFCYCGRMVMAATRSGWQSAAGRQQEPEAHGSDRKQYRGGATTRCRIEK